MKEFQKRVIEEKLELDIKLNKLNVFIESSFFDSLPKEEQERLFVQRYLMQELSSVLKIRIANFTK